MFQIILNSVGRGLIVIFMMSKKLELSGLPLFAGPYGKQGIKLALKTL